MAGRPITNEGIRSLARRAAREGGAEAAPKLFLLSHSSEHRRARKTDSGIRAAGFLDFGK